MSVEALETTDLQSPSGKESAGVYPGGGQVSAMTLIEDVRAIRQRLDSVEVALRTLSGQIEALPSGPGTERAADGGTERAPAAESAPVGSLDELRKALVGDLQVDLRKNTKRSTLLMGMILFILLTGLGGLGWMLHQLE